MVQTFADAVLSTPGLKAYWPLDEVTGTVARELVGGVDATYYGPALGITGPLSDGGSGAQCDGINDYIEAPDSPVWQLGKPVYEWCMWVPSNQSGANIFMACEDEGGTKNRGFCQFFGSATATFHTKREGDFANLVFGVDFSAGGLYNKWVHILWKPGIRGAIINGNAYGFPGGDFSLFSTLPTRLTLGAGRVNGILTRYSNFRFGQLAVYDGSLSEFSSKSALLALGQSHYEAMHTAFGSAAIHTDSIITGRGLRMRTGGGQISGTSRIDAEGHRVRLPTSYPLRFKAERDHADIVVPESRAELVVPNSSAKVVLP